MYSSFDKFLRVDTWYTSHPGDEARFYQCLAKVIGNPEFDPDEMGKFMFSVKDVSPESEGEFSHRIAELVSNAWAVKDFLKYSGGADCSGV